MSHGWLVGGWSVGGQWDRSGTDRGQGGVRSAPFLDGMGISSCHRARRFWSLQPTPTSVLLGWDGSDALVITAWLERITQTNRSPAIDKGPGL